MHSQAGYTYFGTFDDVVQRYPWRFRIDQDYLRFALARQVIDGKPVLLNDGYLIHHPVCRAAVRDHGSLLWNLIDEGFVHVMTRANGRFGLHETPQRMAHIDSYAQLLKSDIWSDWLAAELEGLHGRLEGRGLYRPWPVYDTASGYKVFAERLLSSTAASAGLGGLTRTVNLRAFLQTYLDELDKAPGRGPRDLWEELAKDFSRDPDVTSRPVPYVSAMMRLATEIYHYNMGVGLAATYDAPIAVETQSSAAFDDLLVRPDIIVEDLRDTSFAPRLTIPRGVVEAPADLLIQILRKEDLSKARAEWIAARDSVIGKAGADLAEAKAAAKDAGKTYASRLVRLLGPSLKVRHTEPLFDMAFGALGDVGKSMAKSAATHALGGATGAVGGSAAAALGIKGAAATAATLAAGAAAGAAGGVLASAALGYVIARSQPRILEAVVRPYRIIAAGRAFRIEDAEASRRAIARIKSRRMPSCFDIDRTVALGYASQMKTFA